MRSAFKHHLHAEMKADPRIILLTGDLGFGFLDRIRDEMPAQFINTGSAESVMLGVACGLALSGRIPICHSITPFVLWRPAEQLRLYLNHEGIPVKLLGSGRGWDYGAGDISHYAGDDQALLSVLPRIRAYWPATEADLPAATHEWLHNGHPSYLNLCR
jgi:transketolase